MDRGHVWVLPLGRGSGQTQWTLDGTAAEAAVLPNPETSTRPPFSAPVLPAATLPPSSLPLLLSFLSLEHTTQHNKSTMAHGD